MASGTPAARPSAGCGRTSPSVWRKPGASAPRWSCSPWTLITTGTFGSYLSPSSVCPQLTCMPMDTDYYREFSGRIHALLSRCLGAGAAVERASCDDFYCEIRGGGHLACEAGLRRPPECHVYPSSSSSSSAAAAGPDCGGGTSLKEEKEKEEEKEEDSNRMTAGEEAAVRIRSTLRSELGITASVGIATNKTLAKLIGACILLILSVCPRCVPPPPLCLPSQLTPSGLLLYRCVQPARQTDPPASCAGRR